MTKRYRRPERRFDRPVLLATLNVHRQYDRRSRPIPTDRVPVEKRSGELHLVLALRGLVINSPGTENNYPDGASFAYSSGCEVHVEVYPRGRTSAEYTQWLRDSVVRMALLPGAKSTPLAVSYEAGVYPSGMTRLGPGGDPIRLVSPDKLTPYLTSALPLIGVAAGEVSTAAEHVRKLFLEGNKELVAVAERLAHKRRR
jgi:hypothetical protein